MMKINKINKIILFFCFLFLTTITYASQKIVILGPYGQKQVGNYYKIINNTNKTIMVPYTDNNSNILGNYVNSNFFKKKFAYGRSLDKIYNLGSFTIRNLYCHNVTTRKKQKYKKYYVKRWLIKYDTPQGGGNGTRTVTGPYKCAARRQYKTRYSSRCQALGYSAVSFVVGASKWAYDKKCKDTITLYRYSYDCSLQRNRDWKRVTTTTKVCD